MTRPSFPKLRECAYTLAACMDLSAGDPADLDRVIQRLLYRPCSEGGEDLWRLRQIGVLRHQEVVDGLIARLASYFAHVNDVCEFEYDATSYMTFELYTQFEQALTPDDSTVGVEEVWDALHPTGSSSSTPAPDWEVLKGMLQTSALHWGFIERELTPGEPLAIAKVIAMNRDVMDALDLHGVEVQDVFHMAARAQGPNRPMGGLLGELQNATCYPAPDSGELPTVHVFRRRGDGWYPVRSMEPLRRAYRIVLADGTVLKDVAARCSSVSVTPDHEGYWMRLEIHGQHVASTPEWVFEKDGEFYYNEYEMNGVPHATLCSSSSWAGPVIVDDGELDRLRRRVLELESQLAAQQEP
jgi:hypothetical protein